MTLAVNPLPSPGSNGSSSCGGMESQAPHFTAEKSITQSKIRALDPVPLLLVFSAIQTLQRGCQAASNRRAEMRLGLTLFNLRVIPNMS